MRRSGGPLVTFLLGLGLVGCPGSGSGQRDPVTQALEFYWPVTNSTTYDIVHEWGSYVITMCGAPDEQVHEDSKRYLGYAVHRALPKVPADRSKYPTYLVTPAGEVWRLNETGDIPESSSRTEEVVTKREGGTSTSTTTVSSTAEPVIDHFLSKPGAWTRHGTLVTAGEKQYRLEPVAPVATR